NRLLPKVATFLKSQCSRSDHDFLDLIEIDFIITAVVQSRRALQLMSGQIHRELQCALVHPIVRDALEVILQRIRRYVGKGQPPQALRLYRQHYNVDLQQALSAAEGLMSEQ